MDPLSVYVPIDRLHALVSQQSIPERGEGAALFADLSGFTALTEMLVRDFGPQRGAEELLVFLDQIYDPLVLQVHIFGGSVIGFSGDAITCWFADDSGAQAVACALSMQSHMRAFSALKTSSGKDVSIGLKAAVSTGVTRRFLVGDPSIQVIEALAGTPLERLAAAEHLASRGEVVLDAATVDRLAGKIEVAEWRQDEPYGERYAVIADLKMAVRHKAWPEIPAGSLSHEVIRPWLLPAVFERLHNGRGEFLAELRPSVALFLRFGGIDYVDDDSAGGKLDAYIRQVQAIVDRYEGNLIQLTIGDKGSYLFAAFGAPIAHEDDAKRAVSAATELRRLSPTPEWAGKAQIGISEGRMRTGAYGGRMRRTYGVLGPQTNMAARLMQAAEPEQILASAVVHSATSGSFDWQELPALTLKGFSKPVPVFSLRDVKIQQAIHMQKPRYNLPMIGRERELELIEGKLQQALQGSGQIVIITGEAGMGKSRLVAEWIRSASPRFESGFGGECQSYGKNISYHLWHNTWIAFFNLDPNWTQEEVFRALEDQLYEVNPDLVPRLPLLGPVINIPLPENELTRSLDAKRKKTSLEGLLVECLRARAQNQPLFLVLEDLHWIDPLSGDLLTAIGRSIGDLPVLLMIARRPFNEQDPRDKILSELPYYTEVHLTEFTQAEAERLIQTRMEHFFDSPPSWPAELMQQIITWAQGNPFYIEELLNYIRDKDIDPQEIRTFAQLELPESLHSLILTRIDQRTESQKITLKLSSIIGRLFIAAWLWGAYPELGDPEKVKADLTVLDKLEFTILDTPEPEATYLFKHAITQEVAYEGLPFATRALLHDQLAQFIERVMSDKLDQYVDLLAFHYERSNNLPKKREYLLIAGQAAQAKYANKAAISYYQRLIPLLSGEEKIDVMLKLGSVLELVGEWDEAAHSYREGLDLAESMEDRHLQAHCQIAMGELLRKRGAYQDASAWLQRAQQGFEAASDLAGLGKVLHYTGTLNAQQGHYPVAHDYYQESLKIRRQLGDKTNIANVLNNLGILARYQKDDLQARSLYVESLSIRRELGDRWGISATLNNLGILAMDQGDYMLANTYLDEAITIQRQIGDRYYLANFLNNLGNVARAQGDYLRAGQIYRESLQINRELGDGWQIAYILEDIGGLAALSGQHERALRLIGAASALRETIGSTLPPHEESRLAKMLESTRNFLSRDQQQSIWNEGHEMSLDQAITYALRD